MARSICIVDSITQPENVDGAAIIAGSHGGISSARYAAQLGSTGVIFNDAGIGKDEAGIESLPYLDEFDCPAATVDYRSARIGDGVNMVKHGSIRHVNDTAEDVGCSIGQTVLDCVVTMNDADVDKVAMDVSNELFEEKRSGGAIPVWLLDSIGLVTEKHEGAIVIAGSHGERLAGEKRSHVPTEIAGMTLFDAGVGKDGAGISRLATMNDRGVPAAAVDVHTARIGDARSAWNDGVFSYVNNCAEVIGVSEGDTPHDFVDKVRAANQHSC